MSGAPVIAIDGPSASGKGTVAEKVAKALGFRYLDSGVPDMVWCEFQTSDRKPTEQFANEVRRRFPDAKFAFNWSSSFKWFNDPDPITFTELGELGYKFLFITLAAQHAFGYGFAKLLQGLSEEQQHAYIALQRKEWQVGDDIPTRSHHLFTGVPYHQTMGSVMGASRLGTQFDEKLGEKAV